MLVTFKLIICLNIISTNKYEIDANKYNYNTCDRLKMYKKRIRTCSLEQLYIYRDVANL